MKKIISSIIVLSFAQTGLAADSFTYSGKTANSFAGAGQAMGSNKTVFSTMNADPQMGPVAGFFQAYMNVHGLTRFLQSVLSVATANPKVVGCPTVDATYNFLAADASGNAMGYNIVAPLIVQRCQQMQRPLVSLVVSRFPLERMLLRLQPILQAYFLHTAGINRL